MEVDDHELPQPPSDEAVSCRVSDGKPFANRRSGFEAHQCFVPFDGIVLCILVRGRTSIKGHKKGHKWPFSVCVNLKKDPNRHLRPRTNLHSTIS